MDIITYILSLRKSKKYTDTVAATKADLVGGKVPASQLPSYVDDIVEGYLFNGQFYEDSEHTIIIEPEESKLYVDKVTNNVYRWSGTQYAPTSQTDLSNYYNKTETNQLLGGKVDKEDGKGLSSNDYTDAEKEKLKSVEEGAQKNAVGTVVDPNYVHTDNNYSTNEKNKLGNIEAGAQKNAPYTVTDSNYVHTDNNYTTTEKNKLNGIETGAQKNAPNTVVDANYVHTDNNYDNAAKQKVAQVDDKVNYILDGKHVAKDSTMQDINNALILIAQAKGATKVTTYKEMQRNVRAGLGPVLYPVGFRFTVVHTVYGTLTWIVTGHNQIQSATGKQYTMTCVVKDCIANVQFDQIEAFYANHTTAALAVGTYNITIDSSNLGGLVVGHTYQFTTTVAIPVGGQLRFNTNGDGTINKVLGYSSPASTTSLFSVDLTEGSEGTNLGTIHNTDPTTNINARQRIGWGSNNYKESAMRQFLNSDKPAGQFWEPQTMFDVAPSWLSSLAGFMNGLPAEFLDVVDFAEVKCSTNNFYESPDSKTPKNTKYTLRDKFFLPSRFEVYGSSDVVDDSVLMEYYVGATNADRIKLLNGSARYWWLRTPYSGIACNVRFVYTDGSLIGIGADGSGGCVPACIIA